MNEAEKFLKTFPGIFTGKIVDPKTGKGIEVVKKTFKQTLGILGKQGFPTSMLTAGGKKAGQKFMRMIGPVGFVLGEVTDAKAAGLTPEEEGKQISGAAMGAEEAKWYRKKKSNPITGVQMGEQERKVYGKIKAGKNRGN